MLPISQFLRTGFLILAVWSLPVIGTAASAATLGDADRAAIQQVIGSQLAAFRANDADAAFGLASTTIQAKFQTPANFLSMVQLYYDPVYRPQSFEFMELLQQGGEIVQSVLIIDRRGRSLIALYPMEKDETGRWRIAGCRLIEAPGAGT